MQIALLTELFPPNIGGQEIRFAEIADELAIRGHTVSVFTIRNLLHLPEREQRQSGVTVIRGPYVANYQRKPGSLFPRSPIGMARFALETRRQLANGAFDVIFLNQWPLLHALTLSRQNRKRAIIDWCEIRDSQPYQFFQNFLPRHVAANTAVSHDVAAHISLKTHEQVCTVPSGVVLNRYRAQPAAQRSGLLFLGRLSAHKDVPMLIAAYNVLCAQGFADPLIIAGTGSALPEIEVKVAASPYAARIHLMGAVSDEQKSDLLANARVLVIPSRREGFPRVVAEAMASGLPTVTTRYPGNGTVGVVEYFKCGLCADPNPDAVASAIKAVLANWMPLSEACQAAAARLDMKAIISDLVTLFHRIRPETQGA